MAENSDGVLPKMTYKYYSALDNQWRGKDYNVYYVSEPEPPNRAALTNQLWLVDSVNRMFHGKSHDRTVDLCVKLSYELAAFM